MKIHKISKLILCLTLSSCTFLFGKSLPPLQELSDNKKNEIAKTNNYNFKVFARGFIKVNDEVNRLRIITLCDNSKNRFRLEVIPLNSSIPLGIITGENEKFKFYSPINKNLIKNSNSSKLINELIGVQISDSDICSIFSRKMSSKTALNLKKVIDSSTRYINTKNKNMYVFNPNSSNLNSITLGKYTNSFKIFSLVNFNNIVSITSNEVNVSGKFNFKLIEVNEFKDSVFKL